MSWTRVFVFLPITSLISISALATLGESESSVADVKTRLSGKARVQSLEKFKVHEITITGVVIREYVGSDGRVFAVAWRGMRQPDLEPLLGTYTNEFRAADRQRPERRGLREPVSTKTSQIIVHRSGHMRDIRGLAYLPDRLPAGVALEDLE